MIDLQHTLIVEGAGKKFVAYRDYEDDNLWYIEPTPRLASLSVNGAPTPQFSMVAVKKNEGIVGGTCAFVVEVSHSQEQVDALKAKIGEDIQIGEFDWVDADAFFTFVFDVGEEMVTVESTPTLQGDNQATLVIQLPNGDAVRYFESVFGPQGGATTPFNVDYDLDVLATMDAVDVTVTYDSSMAVAYEKQVDVTKNVWGTETGRKVTIREHIQQSDAGKTEVTWRISDPSEEMRQRIDDWAWLTLEGLVSKAVNDALAALGEKHSDDFSMSSTASFKREYSENQVVEWAFSRTAQLPAFSAEDWAKHYTVVDDRRLTVGFTVGKLDASFIDEVIVTVDYPTAQTDNSHSFTPQNGGTWLFDADGAFSGPDFDPNYKYKFEVIFAGSAQEPYTSDWFDSADTLVRIPASDFGLQVANFVGGNIDFEQVDYVLLDFFFRTPGDLDNRSEQIRITDNTTPHAIQSKTFLPSGNEYSYQLTYVMEDGNRFHVAPVHGFGANNTEFVTINSPFRPVSYDVAALNIQGTDCIERVQLNGTYDDVENELNQNNQWNQGVQCDAGYTELDSWDISVVDNPNAATVTLDGFLIYKNTGQQRIQKTVIQTRFFNLQSDQVPYTVTVDPRRVDWTTVDEVQVNLWRLKNLLAGDDQASILAAEQDKTDNYSMPFLQGLDGTGNPIATPEQYYTFNRPSSGTSQYFLEARYFHKTGKDTWWDQGPDDTRLVTLPSDVSSSIRHIVLVEVDEPEPRQALKSAEAEH